MKSSFDLRGGLKVSGFNGSELATSAGTIKADVFLDASGLKGFPLGERPRVEATNMCVAAQ